MKAATVAILLAGPAAAQLAFYTAEDRRIEIQHALGAVAAGDTADARLRVKNTGTAPVTITTLSVAGFGFSLVQAPRLPGSLGPGGSFEFGVRFRPPAPGAYSAVLRANTYSVILMGTGLAAPALWVEENDVLKPATAALDFGIVERGGGALRRVVVENQTAQTLPSGTVAVTGAGFSLESGPAQPTLEAGEKMELQIWCRPAVTGALNGMLQAAGREIPLRATAVEPPLPRPEVTLTLARAESAQQGRVEVRLASISRTQAAGELRLEFRAAAGLGPDQGVVFSDGSRSVAVRVEEGDALARIGARNSIEFQTGSTAGEIRLTLRLGDFVLDKTVLIPPAPVGIAAAKLSRAAGAVDFQIAGLDNSRSVARVSFTFYDRAGKVLGAGPILAEAADSFRRYFAITDSGTFALRATFPVTGPSEQIESVESEITNGYGTTRTGRIRF